MTAYRLLLSLLILAGCTSHGEYEQVPELWVPAALDTAGVIVPDSLRDFCRPGPWQILAADVPPPEPAASQHRQLIAPDTHFLPLAPNFPEPLRCVIRTEAEWEVVVERLGSHGVPPSLPQIDFERHMVLFVTIGGQAYNGYYIRIDTVYVEDDSLTAVVLRASPADPIGQPLAMDPADAVRVPRIELPVRFVERVLQRFE